MAPQMLTGLSAPLKWAGGKAWLVDRLADLYLPYRNLPLVEPFCGGMSVTLGLNPAAGVCNDTLLPLVNFYRQVAVGLVVETWSSDEATYYAKRARFNAIPHDSPEAAQLFYYLNKTGFNGLCRFNAKGKFNVPRGGDRAFSGRSFDEYRELFARLTFTCGDFEQTPVPSGAFIYADPPYDTPFTTYAPGGFSWSDQVRCARWLARQHGCVVASNQATDRIVELYTSLGFEVLPVKAPRRISCNGNRDDASEILAIRRQL